jgi:transcriptional regulator with GAF, ATPase, and Fis domain
MRAGGCRYRIITMMDKNQISAGAFRKSEQAGSSAALSSLAELTLVPNYGQFKGIIGNSPALRRVLDLVEKVADSNSTVLITGETGTGKELIVRAIHDRSRRADQNLVPVNCGAIPEELLESELFGHVRGAFTNAVENREGRFSLADSGTIFLDEIGDMRPNLQIKLLRVLQERSFEPVGSSKTVKVDVRIIAATNQDLEQAMQEKRFREDLFYRLNVIPINLPPLRERREDVPVLIQHFLERARSEGRSRVEGISNDALDLLCEYGWPGNVRELENLVERLVVLHGEGMIQVEDLPSPFRPQTCFASVAPRVPSSGISFSDEVNRFESDLILQALDQTHWNKQRAAQLLGLNRTTLMDKIKRKGLASDSMTALHAREDTSEIHCAATAY